MCQWLLTTLFTCAGHVVTSTSLWVFPLVALGIRDGTMGRIEVRHLLSISALEASAVHVKAEGRSFFGKKKKSMGKCFPVVRMSHR